MTKEEKFEFLKKKGYPHYYPWLIRLPEATQREFLIWYNEPVKKKYIQDKFEFCKDQDDLTIQRQKAIIALSDPKGSEEFMQMIQDYKKGK